MRRRLFWLAVLFAGGIYAGKLLPIEVNMALCAVLLFTLLLRNITMGNKRTMLMAAMLSISFVAGTVSVSLADDIGRNPLTVYGTRTVDIEGTILSRPERKPHSLQCEFMVTAVTDGGKTDNLHEKVTLSITNPVEGAEFGYGDQIRATAVFSLPPESLNSGGFDYASYLKSKGIFYSCRAYGYSAEVMGHKKLSLPDGLNLLRYRFMDGISRQVPGQEGAVLRGILLGDKSAMTEQTQEAFRRSGLSHVVAVSGMHVGYVMLLLFFLTDLAGFRKRNAGILAGAFLLAYMLLVGCTPSVVRATVMGLIVIIGELAYKKPDTLTSLGIAALVILLPNPLAAFDAGFMLSYAATLGIVLFSGRISVWAEARLGKFRFYQNRILHSAMGIVYVSVAAQVFTVPVLVLLFHEVSLWGIATTILVTPVLPPLMAAGFVLCLADLVWSGLALPFAGFAYVLCGYIRMVASLFARLPAGVIVAGPLSPFFLLVYALAGTSILLHISGKPLVYVKYSLVPLAVLALVWFGRVVFFTQDTAVYFINVGQGDSSLVTLGTGTDILIDAGGTRTDTEESNTGTNVVVPFLKSKGVSDIEVAMVSHYHDDHARGMLGVLSAMPVDRLVMPFTYEEGGLKEELLQKAEQTGTEVVFVEEGDSIGLGGEAGMEILTPDPDWLKGQQEQNNNSIVTRLDFGTASVLYTGDMEAAGEELLLTQQPDSLSADILKVGHHGSQTSSTQPFLDAVSPRYAVICAGEGNSYGHPHAEVLTRLAAAGAQVVRTDLHKDIGFFIGSDGVQQVWLGEPSPAEK